MLTLPRKQQDKAAATAVDADGAADRIRARLFDTDRTDRVLSFAEALEARVSSHQLLWIDIEDDLTREEHAALVERFELEEDTAAALRPNKGGPNLELHGRHFHLRVAAEPDPERPEDPTWLDLIAGPHVVISRHAAPVRFLQALNQRIKADATIGELDSAEFIASLLDGVVTTYHLAIDRIEDELDAHDTRSLTRDMSNGEAITQLVAIRRRVARLRRLLATHREVFGSLSRPSLARGVSPDNPEVFLPVSSRFDAALVSVESSRELVVSSFDVLMTRTAQRTNDVMRALTLITVLGLPATITAGFLGMNVIVPVSKDDPTSFWVIAGIVIVLEAVLVGIARLKRWI